MKSNNEQKGPPPGVPPIETKSRTSVSLPKYSCKNPDSEWFKPTELVDTAVIEASLKDNASAEDYRAAIPHIRKLLDERNFNLNWQSCTPGHFLAVSALRSGFNDVLRGFRSVGTWMDVVDFELFHEFAVGRLDTTPLLADKSASGKLTPPGPSAAVSTSGTPPPLVSDVNSNTSFKSRDGLSSSKKIDSPNDEPRNTVSASSAAPASKLKALPNTDMSKASWQSFPAEKLPLVKVWTISKPKLKTFLAKKLYGQVDNAETRLDASVTNCINDVLIPMKIIQFLHHHSSDNLMSEEQDTHPLYTAWFDHLIGIFRRALASAAVADERQVKLHVLSADGSVAMSGKVDLVMYDMSPYRAGQIVSVFDVKAVLRGLREDPRQVHIQVAAEALATMEKSEPASEAVLAGAGDTVLMFITYTERDKAGRIHHHTTRRTADDELVVLYSLVLLVGLRTREDFVAITQDPTTVELPQQGEEIKTPDGPPDAAEEGEGGAGKTGTGGGFVRDLLGRFASLIFGATGKSGGTQSGTKKNAIAPPAKTIAVSDSDSMSSGERGRRPWESHDDDEEDVEPELTAWALEDHVERLAGDQIVWPSVSELLG